MNDVVIADGILDWADSSIDSDSIEKIKDFGSGTDYWLMVGMPMVALSILISSLSLKDLKSVSALLQINLK